MRHRRGKIGTWLLLVVLSAWIIFIAFIVLGIVAVARESSVITPQPHTPTLTRPQLCIDYLSLDTEDWIDCMGVGYVRRDI